MNKKMLVIGIILLAIVIFGVTLILNIDSDNIVEVQELNTNGAGTANLHLYIENPLENETGKP